MAQHSHFEARPLCEICGSETWTIALSRAFTDPAVLRFLRTYYAGSVDEAVLADGKFEIARCSKCDFHWQLWILNAAGLATLYEKWIDSESSCNKRTSGDAKVFSAYGKEMLVVGAFADQNQHQLRVLDHGMGWGYWGRMAMAYGFEAYGTELSVRRRAHSAGMGVKVVELDQLPAEFFDFVNSEQSFEHIPRPRENMQKLARAIRVGGILRVAVPDATESISHLANPNWRAAKDALHPLEHINAFTPSTLERLGREAGLQPVTPPAYPMFASSVRDHVRLLWRSIVPRQTTTKYFRKL
jgi:SAM-dependent methyltransferase